ncbi:MAG: glycoside hydrolase family 3 C-terminal domain-containing protein [Lachnospiraceae bacterium]|nr:glycoside hydrolase family 3 C-terminal domain-containing protein [Lachnospiraceae bacterium]
MSMEKAKRLEEDARALVEKMTIEEVASQLKYDAEAVKRLGIPEYNWWNEALHGVARAGTATVFPQAIGLAAMFDEKLLCEIAGVISTEARAKYNAQSAEDDRDIYKGLTMWSPNINIFRDPRWGRGHETYGEDPYLTSRLGVSFIKGLQGTENYPDCDTLKAAACAKHYAVHSGPEGERHHFDAKASAKDMEETYLPAFEAAVKEGKVESVMGAYNRTNGEPCCGSTTLIRDILRGKWGFKGHFVSDCWAVRDFHENHKITNTPAESAAMALNAGCDLNCGNTYLCILAALKEKRVKEEDLREACVRLMKTRMKLGILPRTDEEETAKTNAYAGIGYLENDTDEHRALALKAAQKSAVLLKNNGVLPLKEGEYPVIGVIGPNADSIPALEGNYNGTASLYVTNLEGIRKNTESRVLYSVGSHLFKDKISNLAKYNDDRMSEAVTVTKNSDLVILCLGLDSTLEGEEGDTGNMFASGDKRNLLLTEAQQRLARSVVDTAKENGKKVIAVINSGSALDLSYLDENADAVLQCWYSGEEGGQALADLLFGRANPSGKLPLTFYKEGNLPEFTDYSMKNRTYRYYKGDVLYPFGYGLSYTEYETSFEVEKAAGFKVDEPLIADYEKMQSPAIYVNVTIRNRGIMDGEEVILIFTDKESAEKKASSVNTKYADRIDPENQPIKSLCAFKRAFVKAGDKTTVKIPVSVYSLTTVLEDGTRVFLPGEYSLLIGNEKHTVLLK